MSFRTGFSKIDITPEEPVRLAGYSASLYSGRREPFQAISQRIFVRGMAVGAGTEEPALILAAELCGWGPNLCAEIYHRLAKECGLKRERIILSATHNHSGPVTLDVLPLYHDFGEEEYRCIERYTRQVVEAVVACARAALDNLEPCRLEFGFGFAGFGVNRRRVRSGQIGLPGPVDPDVPVLVARRPDDSISGLVFGYACHTTSQKENDLHGDYSGQACAELESEFGGAVAVFMAGCGGDINPIPRYRPGLESLYGHLLATAVKDVTDRCGVRSGVAPEPFSPEPSLACALEAIELPLEIQTTAAEFAAQHACETSPDRRRQLAKQVADAQNGGLVRSVPFTVQTWRLGRLLWIALAGEPVVDFSLLLRARYGWANTWVAGYCDDLVSYIPSERVLREGGYEGTTGMLEYGWAGPYASGCETRILESVQRQIAG